MFSVALLCALSCKPCYLASLVNVCCTLHNKLGHTLHPEQPGPTSSITSSTRAGPQAVAAAQQQAGTTTSSSQQQAGPAAHLQQQQQRRSVGLRRQQ
jgi:hypothetical protein